MKADLYKIFDIQIGDDFGVIVLKIQQTCRNCMIRSMGL